MSDDLIVDLSNYRNLFGDRVEPDRYRVIVENAEADESKAGNDMINIWFRIIGGEFDGKTIVDRLTLTERAMFRVVGFMQALGMPTPRKKLRIRLSQFVGKQMEIEVDDGEPYNGRVKSEVRAYFKVTKSAAAAPDLDDIREDEDEEDDAIETETEAVEPTPATEDAPATPAPEAAEPKRRRKKAPEPEPTPVDEDEDADEDVDLDNIRL